MNSFRISLQFVLVTDSEMVALNNKWFGKNESTDVISFPMEDTFSVDRKKLIGEIVVNQDEVMRNAKEYGVTYAQELARVVAHGVLHVVGYEDDTEPQRRAMRVIEDAVVKEIK